MASAQSSTKSPPKLLKCAGCPRELPKKEYLTCARCNGKYDLDCANVSSQRFYNTMTADHKKAWICPICRCTKSKPKQDDTPMSPLNDCFSSTIIDPSEKSNITVRRGPKSKILNTSINSEDLNELGDTLNNTIPSAMDTLLKEPLTLQSINSLMKLNLEKNNISILSEIRAIVQSQIDDAIYDLRNEIHKQREQSKKEYSETQTKIENINSKIKLLNSDLNKLKAENQQLKTQLHNSTYIPTETKLTFDPAKTIVLYGLTENHWDSNEQTYDRVVRAMYEILNVDLTGYIEELTWIGKRGTRRPIRIELISKRMTNYLLSCGKYFKNTGIGISEHLNEQSLRERRVLKEAMIAARRNNQHAVLRKNKLIINGRETTIQDLREVTASNENKPQRYSESNIYKNNDRKTNNASPPHQTPSEPEIDERNNLQHSFRN